MIYLKNLKILMKTLIISLIVNIKLQNFYKDKYCSYYKANPLPLT